MIAPVNIVIAILEDIGLNINIRPHIIDKIEVIIVSIHTGSSIFFKEIDNLSLKILIHINPVSYTHLRAHETDSYLVCRLLLEKKKK